MSKDFDKEKWATEQDALKKQLLGTVQQIVEGYQDSPEDIAELLAFRARFHNYSVRNTILIQKQNSGASFVGSFQRFKELGYPVNRGEHGMKIFVPITVTLLRDGEDWIPLSQASNELKRLAKAGQIPQKTALRFKLGTVFDISQTNCPVEDYPKIYHMGYPSELHGQLVEGLKQFCEKELGCPVREMHMSSIALHGTYHSKDHHIEINDRMQDTQKLNTLAHEMGHAILHRNAPKEMPTSQIEMEADAVSILLQSRLGLELSDSRKRHLASHYRTYREQREREPSLPDLNAILTNVFARFDQLLPEMQRYLVQCAPEKTSSIKRDPNEVSQDTWRKSRRR